MVDIAKIYVRAIIGILGAVSATYLVGATVELEMMLGCSFGNLFSWRNSRIRNDVRIICGNWCVYLP
jgi:hypothetical protein